MQLSAQQHHQHLSSPNNLNIFAQSSPYSSRFSSNSNQQNMMNVMRSPSNSLSSGSLNFRQLQQQQLHNDVNN